MRKRFCSAFLAGVMLLSLLFAPQTVSFATNPDEGELIGGPVTDPTDPTFPGELPNPTDPTASPTDPVDPNPPGGGSGGPADPTTPTDPVNPPENPSTPTNPEAPTVLIQAHDTSVEKGDATFALTSAATAKDELGNQLPVVVVNDGGFSIDAIGVYFVVFEAEHPVTLEKFLADCLITVLHTEGNEVEEPQKSTLQGTSDDRYRKYAQYRDEVSAELSAHMERLNAQFESRMNLLRGAFFDVEQYTLVRQFYSEQTESDDTLDEAFALQADFEELDAPTLCNWSQVLAVYVAKNTELTVEDPLDLFNLRKISFDAIDEVFWDMHDLRFEMQDGAARMILIERTSDEMAERYGFSAERRAQLDELMQPEFLRLFAALTGDTNFSDMTEAEAAAIRATLPMGLNMHQEKVVMTAHTLVGQVKYFWGGKYPEVGWNPLWGVPKVVTSQNSPTTGTVRPFGLDCSGFVTWVFINAAEDPGVISAIGNGSSNQWRNSRAVGWDEAQPGDLAFKAAPGATPTNHVGVVVERRADGTILVAHSSSSKNGVVVTEAWSSSFRYIRRPALYN